MINQGSRTKISNMIFFAGITLLLMGLLSWAGFGWGKAYGETAGPTPTTGGLITQADPVITKSVDKTNAFPGETLTYTIVVTNKGSETATGISVSDPISEWLIPVSSQTSKGTVKIEGNVVTISIGDINPGEIVNITIVTRVKSDTKTDAQITNEAMLHSDVAGLTNRFSTAQSVKVNRIGLPVTGSADNTGGKDFPWLPAGLISSGLLFLFVGAFFWVKGKRQSRI